MMACAVTAVLPMKNSAIFEASFCICWGVMCDMLLLQDKGKVDANRVAKEHCS